MAQTLHLKTLLDVGAVASTGDWLALDYRNYGGTLTAQSILGTVVSGDTVYIEVTNEVPYVDNKPVTVTQVVTVSAYTENFSLVLNGPVAAIRARKTGTTGAAKVTGVLV